MNRKRSNIKYHRQQQQQQQQQQEDKPMLDSFSPWKSIGKILPTSTRSQQNKRKIPFDYYRPHRQCIDYDISQTFIQMMKGENLKFNLKQTVAEYKEIPEEICKPKREKKEKLFSGVPAQRSFIEETREKEVEKLQKHARKYRSRVEDSIRSYEIKQFQTIHNRIQELCGPDWFLELSPQQLKAVDSLQKHIATDLSNGSTIKSQASLAGLGLVLRPNQRHVAIALKHCCGCPIEFLLILYHILNKHRLRYSLNDGLILSAVVHLGIRDTLKELHVRIPSPPRCRVKPQKKEEKKRSRHQCESPYLQSLTYTPPKAKYTGIYKDKHRQRPESPYFSYLSAYKLEKISHPILNYQTTTEDTAEKQRLTEYQNAQKYFETFPQVKKLNLTLIAPKVLSSCPNFLRRHNTSTVDERFVIPPLSKVWESQSDDDDDDDDTECFCDMAGDNSREKKSTKSDCKTAAEKLLAEFCVCDDCLEEAARQNILRVHGGLKQMFCSCGEAVPIIQGTKVNETCQCLKAFRNRTVACAARQKLEGMVKKHVVTGVTMTKFGPVYNIASTLGRKICSCDQIRQRKQQLNIRRSILLNNKAKFVIAGVIITKDGPIFNLVAMVARKPCGCVTAYNKQLEILAVQNEVRRNSVLFVNNGLILSRNEIVFHYGGIMERRLLDEIAARSEQTSSPVLRVNNGLVISMIGPVFYYGGVMSIEESPRELCSCGITRPKCFHYCQKYFEYQPVMESSEETDYSSTSSSGDDSSSDSELESDTDSSTEESETVDSSSASSFPKQPSKVCECRKMNLNMETDSGQQTPSDSCRCKEELARFMQSKCPCEECNRQIRQQHATYVICGTKSTSSGNQINLIEGIHQPLCKCLHEHIENLKKIDDYKNRIKVNYELKKQPNKYTINGVANTPEGPVYVISGLRPPVECECALLHREEQERVKHEREMAQMPNTGRNQYEIAGVKSWPDGRKNVYILSRALQMPKCDCEKMLEQYESVHKSCLMEYDSYMKQTRLELEKFGEVEKSQAAMIQSTSEQEEEVEFDTDKPEHKSLSSSAAEQTDKTSEMSKSSSRTVSTSSSSSSSSGSDDIDSERLESSSPSEQLVSQLTACYCCQIDKPLAVTPIKVPLKNVFPKYFLSRRFAIFRKFPKRRTKQMEILIHILQGMADDGFPLAKLPCVHKLPIFKLWFQMRCGVSWSCTDRWRYYWKSKELWKHTDVCYRKAKKFRKPFTSAEADQMTWGQAKMIRRSAEEKINEYYRDVKHANIAAAREFFGTTFSYEFPTIPRWRPCFAAYMPTKEEQLHPFRIYFPNDVSIIPENKKLNCNC